MLLLTIRTDKPEAELGLFDNAQQLAYLHWEAHRQLAETIHLRIKELLDSKTKTLSELEGLVVFKGPGSFTGLRIGLSVANALADSLKLPIVSAGGGQWLKDGLGRLERGEDEMLALPDYGSPPHITRPKH